MRELYGTVQYQSRAQSTRTITLEPALDVGSEPTSSASGAFCKKRSSTHPAIDGDAVPTGDPLDVTGAQDLIDSGNRGPEECAPEARWRRRLTSAGEISWL
jgi:hypothetical protein